MQADFLRIDGAVGSYSHEMTRGNIIDNTITQSSFDMTDLSGFIDEKDFYGWVRIKHPVPILPI